MSSRQNAGEATMLSKEVSKVVKVCRAVHAKWRRAKLCADCPGVRPPAVLKTEIYRLALQCNRRQEREDWPFSADDVIMGASRREGTNYGVKTIWHSLISLTDRAETLSRSERDRYAIELEYARRHRVPVELVTGFVWQVGGAKRIKTLAGDHREHWFDGERHTADAFKAPALKAN